MTIQQVLIIGVFISMMFFLARQLGKPSGWFGRAVMGWMLNQGNRTIIEAAVRALSATSGERIADVGFGGGYELELLAPLVEPARMCGVEISEAMIDAAKRHWGEAVEIYRADALSMPFGDSEFDGIVSVNTIYFWNDPAAVLREFRRVLKPTGRLVLGIRKKEFIRWSPVSWFGFRLYSSAEIETMLGAARFEAKIHQTKPGELIVVARPSREH
jgi:arsenite methyltransferase